MGAYKRLRFFSSKEELIRGGKKRVVYTALDELDDAESKLKNFAKSGIVDLKVFEKVVRTLEPMNATQSEIVATLFAAWNDLLLDGEEPTDIAIIREVRDNWHEAKKKFSEFRLESALKWMKKNGFVPAGIGPRTLAG